MSKSVKHAWLQWQGRASFAACGTSAAKHRVTTLLVEQLPASAHFCSHSDSSSHSQYVPQCWHSVGCCQPVLLLLLLSRGCSRLLLLLAAARSVT